MLKGEEIVHRMRWKSRIRRVIKWNGIFWMKKGKVPSTKSEEHRGPKYRSLSNLKRKPHITLVNENTSEGSNFLSNLSPHKHLLDTHRWSPHGEAPHRRIQDQDWIGKMDKK